MDKASYWAGQLREGRQRGEVGKEQGYDKKNFRQTKRIKKVVSQKIKKTTNGAKVATNRLLSASWLSLIPSFGLSLIWINIHAFMHMLFPSIFGKLGEEWVPGQAQLGEVNEAAKTANKTAGIVEGIALLLLDLLAIFALLAAVVIIMMVIELALGIMGKAYMWFFYGEKVYTNPQNGMDEASKSLGYIINVFRAWI